jgi:hypothetical protein
MTTILALLIGVAVPAYFFARLYLSGRQDGIMTRIHENRRAIADSYKHRPHLLMQTHTDEAS